MNLIQTIKDLYKELTCKHLWVRNSEYNSTYTPQYICNKCFTVIHCWYRETPKNKLNGDYSAHRKAFLKIIDEVLEDGQTIQEINKVLYNE